MVSPLIAAIFLGLIIYRVYKYCVYRPEGFPPGPFRIPFFGSYLLLLLIDRLNLHLAVKKLCKFYKTSVIGFYHGGNDLFAIANDQKSIREVFFNPDLDGRGDFLIVRLREPKFTLKGIFFIDGAYWNDQRRFTLRNLRDFGFGRRFEDYEIEVRDEMQALVSMIKEGPRYEHEKKFLRDGGEISLPKALIGCLANCFLQVISNERLPRAEQELLFKAGYASMTFQKMSNEYGLLFGIMHWIRYIFPMISSFKPLREASIDMLDLMKIVIAKQKKTYEDGHARNFIDVYIKEIKETEANHTNSGYLYEQLLMVCTDFMFPALSAIETTIAFLFKHLLYRGDILKKIQDEIDTVVGSGRFPGLDDRSK